MSNRSFDFAQARQNMAENQVRAYEVLSQRVLGVIETLPREAFVPARYRNLAYTDSSIPLAHAQMMLSPKVEGRLLQATYPRENESILAIGTGSGYLAACLGKLAKSVVSVDVFPDFTESAAQRVAQLDIDNVTLRTENAAHGIAGDESFDVVIVEAALRTPRRDFHRHVRDGGRLLLMVGEGPRKEVWLWTRVNDESWLSESLFDTDLPYLLDPNWRPAFEF